MEISIQHIKQKLNQDLPGLSSHLKMASSNRIHELKNAEMQMKSAMKSAVMILLYPYNNQLKVVLIRRSFYVGIHAGQIAFPGGRYEDFDIEIKNTALREIQEEMQTPGDCDNAEKRHDAPQPVGADQFEREALPDGFHDPDRHRAAHDPGHVEVARNRVGELSPIRRCYGREILPGVVQNAHVGMHGHEEDQGA